MRKWDWQTLSTGVMALFTVGLFGVGYLQWQTFRKTEEDGVLLGRVFVYREGYRLIPSRDEATTAIIKWSVVPIIENSGNIPVQFRIRTDWSRERAIIGDRLQCPGKFVPISELKTYPPRVRAPHQAREDEGGPIGSVSIEDIRSQRGYYVHGIISYLDEFTGQERQTRFCDGIIFVGNPGDQNNFTYQTVATTTGNCMDDQCDKEDHTGSK